MWKRRQLPPEARYESSERSETFGVEGFAKKRCNLPYVGAFTELTVWSLKTASFHYHEHGFCNPGRLYGSLLSTRYPCGHERYPVWTYDLEIPVWTYDLEIPVWTYDLEIPVWTYDLEIPVWTYDLEISVWTYDLEISVWTYDLEIPMWTYDLEIPVWTYDLEISVWTYEQCCIIS
ncbi:hypothetical protein STEG23_003755 [Scotinomys teguina]